MGAQGISIAGANMWALLSEDDPTHSSISIGNNQNAEIDEEEEAVPADNVRAGTGSAKTTKRGKKTKKMKKKKGNAGDCKKAEQINGHEEKETPASELEEEMSEEEEEMSGEAATAGSCCLTVAWRVCKAAVAVAMLGLYFQVM